MIRATTPTFTLTLNDQTVDLTEATNVYVTVTQGSVIITKSGEDLTVTAHNVQCWLTQEETLLFNSGKADIQLNWLYTDALDQTVRRAATKIKSVTIDRQLLAEVLPEVVEGA